MAAGEPRSSPFAAKRTDPGVPGSAAAHEAGLRDGQKLMGFSIQFGQTDKAVELTVDDAGTKKEIRYLPRWTPAEVPHYVPVKRD